MATVEELLRENEALRLQLFWKDHSDWALKELMIDANQCGSAAPRCACLVCAISGRTDDEDPREGPETPCRFKPWIEAVIARCGMRTIVGTPDGLEPGQHESCTGRVYDLDCHIHHLAVQDWFAFSYGARLWRARSVRDPELDRLRALFAALEDSVAN